MSDALENLARAFQPGPRPGPGRTPGPIGMTILLLLWVGLGVLPFVSAVSDLKLATGSVGTPGTLTVVSCEDLGEGRYDCKGSFTPDGGGAAIPVDASPDSSAGDVKRARLTPEGDRAVPTGTPGILAALTLPFLGVGVFAFLPYVVMYVFGVRRGRRAAVAFGGLLVAVSLVGVVVGMVAAYS
ncbi:hypothetical protein FHS43_004295 [Streptosporangium becharense]|uniref:Uncharacterized protein n=1 Tax=Streptosporangium becharense TaxID=1816182 RepID=A0A7W9ICF8_9ACTN|nr:hypothetical protein [Streptosporangium becharense]MBB2913000.1 hypothetical protein [Streptosporangium becharense]MBB5818175.1 hypothetical protein [Streptosporangium becharense]